MSRHKLLLILMALLAALALPALAQEETVHTVIFDGAGFQFSTALGDGVNIQPIAGDPVEQAGPGFSDAAKTQFTLYRFGEPMDSLFDTGGVRLYRMAELARYDFLQAQVERLQTLLAERPDLTPFEAGINSPSGQGLPYVPVLTHGQVLAARAQYVETSVAQGISYIAAHKAALEPFSPVDFAYIFQGISTDGQYYIAVTFPLTTGLFPESLENFDFEAFQAEWPEYLAASIATLNTAAPDAFTPPLDAVDALIQSIHFDTR
jgi:hypothetical protein